MPRLRGKVPYGETATVRQTGRRRKERLRSGAFSRSAGKHFEETPESVASLRAMEALKREAVEVLDSGGTISDGIRNSINSYRRELERYRRMPDVTLLRGHNFDSPLAQTAIGTLILRETNKALEFDAVLPAPEHQPEVVRDTLKMIRSGMILGISPGFRLPPAARNPNAERFVQDPEEDVLTREVIDAILYELSFVSRPVYKGTEIDEVRGEGISDLPNITGVWPVELEVIETRSETPIIPVPVNSFEERLWL